MKNVLRLADITPGDAPCVGGKAARLAVPPGFVITASAHRDFQTTDPGWTPAFGAARYYAQTMPRE
jgi:phosphoenolpyruvate synthase/pyruvate phosphate dikinase